MKVKIGDENMKSEYMLSSETVKSEIVNRRIVIESDIKISNNVKFINCDIEYSEKSGKIVLDDADALFDNCSIGCHSADDEKYFFIECNDNSIITFEKCVFKYCENFIVAKSNKTKVIISNSEIQNPGEKFVHAVLGTNSMFEIKDSTISLDDSIEYTDQTIIFNIARVDHNIHPRISNVKIISGKMLENVRWFLCMGAHVEGGEYTRCDFHKLLKGHKLVNTSYEKLFDF